MASLHTSASPQPPPTVPVVEPSAEMTIRAPTSRGVDPRVRTTVATATTSPVDNAVCKRSKVSLTAAVLPRRPGLPRALHRRSRGLYLRSDGKAPGPRVDLRHPISFPHSPATPFGSVRGERHRSLLVLRFR